MLSPSLVSAVEQDLAVARQLAYFFIGYSPDGQDMEVEPEQFVSGALPDTVQTSHDPAANAATHIRVAVSNPVQRPRQGTCAVLMELTRPLTWLSHRGRTRGSAGGGGSAATVGGGAAGTAGSGGSRPASVASANISPSPSATAAESAVSATAGASTSTVPGTSGSTTAAFSASGAGTTGRQPGPSSVSAAGSSRSAYPAAATTTTASTTAAATPAIVVTAPALPLLVATATLEVVFPARYPHEPCQWRLSEEVTFGGVGDHSTSSWAVTAGHRGGSRNATATSTTTTTTNTAATTNGNTFSSTSGAAALPGTQFRAGTWTAGTPPGGEEGLPRRPISTRLLAATSGENTLKLMGGEGLPAAAGAVGGPTKLTAFVVPALGRRLLRRIAETRACYADGRAASAASPAAPSSPLFPAAGGQARASRSSGGDVSPFLMDFACLLRCWSAMEIDVHHLLLPSRVAMAYGGGGARLLRAMTGTHLSGGGSASAAVGAASSSGGLLSPSGGGGGAMSNSNNVAGGSGSGANSGKNAAALNASALHAASSLGSTLSNSGTATTGGAKSTTALLAAAPAGAGGVGGSAGLSVPTSSTATAPVNLSATFGGSGGGMAGGAGTAAAANGSGGGSGGTSSSAVVAGPGSAATSAVTGASALYPYRRRAVRHFIAVLLPQGAVAVCGRVPPTITTTAPTRRTGHPVASTTTANATASATGTPSAAAAAAASTAGAATGNTAKTNVAARLEKLPLCLVPLYEPTKKDDAADSAPGSGSNTTTAPRTTANTTTTAAAFASSSRRPAVPGTLLGCTSQFVRGKVLPSFLLPTHVLGSPYKCEWDDVSLFTGRGADAALHANAKLAKALRLPHISNLLQVLRRLARNVGTTTTGVVYIDEVLWPTLMETVRVLRSSRVPFWAGLAVCALLLPSVLEHDEPRQQYDWQGSADGHGATSTGGGRPQVGVIPATPCVASSTSKGARPLRRWRQHLAELIQVVTYTERVLALAREFTLLCEARLVRCALQRGQQLLQRDDRGDWRSDGVETSDASVQAALSSLDALPPPPLEMCRRLHAPISVCAVCGLSLLRNTVKHGAAGEKGTESTTRASTTASPAAERHAIGEKAKHTHTDSGTAAVRNVLQMRRAEGCLVVQCARCGHGGHVEHMSSWWTDPTVHCCPKGCDCICEY